MTTDELESLLVCQEKDETRGAPINFELAQSST